MEIEEVLFTLYDRACQDEDYRYDKATAAGDDVTWQLSARERYIGAKYHRMAIGECLSALDLLTDFCKWYEGQNR